MLIPSAQLLCDYLGKTNSDIVILFDGRRCIDYHWRLVIVEINNLVTHFYGRGRRLLPLHVRCRRKTFAFAMSSSAEHLFK